MEIILYSDFSKRKNSTKNPESPSAISVSVTKQVTLKGECSRLRPSFFISDITGFVYCKAWGWYYFITNVAYDINGAQYIDCEIDVLGTWRDVIMSTRAFVRLSSSNYNENIIDDRIAQRVTYGYDIEVESSIFTSNGCYIISTVNNDTLYGGVTSYAVTEGVLRTILTSLINDDTLWGSLEMYFNDVSSAILSCRYVPVDISEFYSTQGANVVIGDWDTGESGYVTDGKLTDYVTIAIPWRYTDFRRFSDFTKFILSLPFVGCIDMSPEKLIGQDSMFIGMAANAITGNIIYRLTVGGQNIATYSGSFGRSIPISTSQKDVDGFLNGLSAQAAGAIGGAIGSTALGLGLATTPAGQFALAAGMVKSAYSLSQGVLQSTSALHKTDFTHIGGFGGGFGEELISEYILSTMTYDSQTEPSELTGLYGRPCYKVLDIGSLSGYVQTMGFSIDISAPDPVKTAINDAMDNGVYLE